MYRFNDDVRKRRNRTVTPGGTITRTLIDVRSLVTSAWNGTGDVGGRATLLSRWGNGLSA